MNCILLYLYKYKIEPRYALIKGDVPADSLASFINAQIYPAFRFQAKKKVTQLKQTALVAEISKPFVSSWKDAEWLCSEWQGPRAIKVNSE